MIERGFYPSHFSIEESHIVVDDLTRSYGLPGFLVIKLLPVAVTYFPGIHRDDALRNPRW
jgi:hypothetical protein